MGLTPSWEAAAAGCDYVALDFGGASAYGLADAPEVEVAELSMGKHTGE